MGSHSWAGARRSFGAPPSSVLRGGCDFDDALVTAWRCGRAGGPAVPLRSLQGSQWPCATSFSRAGRRRDPPECGLHLLYSEPPPPLGNHRVGVWPIGGRPPLQGGQGQWLSAPAGFARVLRCSTEYKLPAVGAMPGHSPGLEHSPSNQGRGELRPAAFAPELCEPSSSGRSELPSGGSINKPALCLSVSESCRVFLRRRSASRLWASCRLQPAGPARSSR